MKMNWFHALAAFVTAVVFLVRQSCSTRVRKLYNMKHRHSPLAEAHHSRGDCSPYCCGYMPPKYKHDPAIEIDNEYIGTYPCDTD